MSSWLAEGKALEAQRACAASPTSTLMIDRELMDNYLEQQIRGGSAKEVRKAQMALMQAQAEAAMWRAQFEAAKAAAQENAARCAELARALVSTDTTTQRSEAQTAGSQWLDPWDGTPSPTAPQAQLALPYTSPHLPPPVQEPGTVTPARPITRPQPYRAMTWRQSEADNPWAFAGTLDDGDEVAAEEDAFCALLEQRRRNNALIGSSRRDLMLTPEALYEPAVEPPQKILRSESRPMVNHGLIFGSGQVHNSSPRHSLSPRSCLVAQDSGSQYVTTDPVTSAAAPAAVMMADSLLLNDPSEASPPVQAPFKPSRKRPLSGTTPTAPQGQGVATLSRQPSSRANDRHCLAEGCSKRPSYGYPSEGAAKGRGAKQAHWCRTHAKEGMEDLKNQRCFFKGPSGEVCKSQPSYALPGDKRPTRCRAHVVAGMENVKMPRCGYVASQGGEGCKRQPLFGTPGVDLRPQRCRSHMEPGMRDMRGAACTGGSAAEGCMKRPSYGFLGDPRPSRCGAHKLAGMQDLISARCDAPDCTTVASFGFPEANGGVGRAGRTPLRRTRCYKHKEEGMVCATKGPACSHPGGCQTRPSFGFPPQATEGEPVLPKPERCKPHSLPGMVYLGTAARKKWKALKEGKEQSQKPASPAVSGPEWPRDFDEVARPESPESGGVNDITDFDLRALDSFQ